MKTIVTLIALALFAFSSYGQQALALKILEGADNPNTQTQQYYLFEVANNYNYDEEIIFEINDVTCPDILPSNQVSLSRSLFNQPKTTQIQTIFVRKNKKGIFYLKIFRATNQSMNDAGKWNCTSIKATAKDGTVYSNTIIITSLIPNPSNNN